MTSASENHKNIAFWNKWIMAQVAHFWSMSSSCPAAGNSPVPYPLDWNAQICVLSVVLFCFVVFLHLCRKVVGYISFRHWAKLIFSMTISYLVSLLRTLELTDLRSH